MHKSKNWLRNSMQYANKTVMWSTIDPLWKESMTKTKFVF